MTRLALVLFTLTATLFIASLLVGPAGMGATESLSALLWGDGGPLTLVMREIRLPRAVLALMIGAALGLAGAAMQGYLRNPLADPGLILAGIAISALAAALTSLVLNLSPNPFAANEIVFWMMGSLADRSMVHVWIALPLIVLGAVALATLARGLDALTLGEDAAQALGINLTGLRLTLVFGTAAVVGASTAVAGAIGFVGLVVPHLLRPFVGAQPGRLLWASAFGGACMLLAADIAVRVILPARDLKLGVVTALIGAPLFLHLIYRTRREGI